MYNKVNEVTPLPSIKFIHIVLMVLIPSYCAMLVFAHAIDRFSALSDPSLLLGPYIWFWLCATLSIAGAIVLIGAVLPTIFTAVIYRFRKGWCFCSRTADSPQKESKSSITTSAPKESAQHDTQIIKCSNISIVLDIDRLKPIFDKEWPGFQDFVKTIIEASPNFNKRDFGRIAYILARDHSDILDKRFWKDIESASKGINFKLLNQEFHDALGLQPSSPTPWYYKDGSFTVKTVFDGIL